MNKHLPNSLRALFLSLAVLLSLPMLAAQVEIDGINYDLNAETKQANVIAKTSGKYSGEVVIPESVEHEGAAYSVTSIGDHAFYYCSGLTSVTIGNSVTSIGSSAFYDCSGLTSVTIGNSVTSIGASAFYRCYGLTSVTIGNSVTSIGSSAFRYCSGLTLVTIGNSVTSIGSYAFEHCSGLTSVTIPNSVTSIGSSAFEYCPSLRKVLNFSNLNITKKSSSYGYVGYYASLVLNNPEIIDNYVFAPNGNTYALYGYLGTDTNLQLPEKYKGENYDIGDYAFEYCSGLTSVTIPNSVTSIGAEAFAICSGLTSVTIPNSVTSIGASAFYNCSGLTLVTIGNNVTSIGDYAFRGCSSLTSVTIPNSVTSIGDYAFYNCNLKNLIIGTGVLSIGSDQSKPTKVIWLTNTPPNGYTNLAGTINYVANDNYTQLSNKKVYKYLSSYFEVDGIVYVPVNPSARTCDAISCSYDSTATSISIDETVSYKGIAMSVENVMPYTAYRQTSVKTLSLSPKSDIGNYAFYGCTGITNATISNEGIIGTSAFEGAMQSGDATLKVTIPGVIEDRGFYGCTNLKTAEINIVGGEDTEDTSAPLTFDDWTSTNTAPSSVSSKTYTFTVQGESTLSFDWWVSSESGYDKLIATLDGTAILEKSGITSGTFTKIVGSGSHTLDVKYSKDNSNSYGQDKAKVSNIKVILKPSASTSDLLSIGNEAFRGCNNLSSITLGEGIKSIGDYAFYGCSKLTEVTIPNKTTSLGEYCFSGNSLLADIDLGNGLETIGQYCFSGCSMPEISIPASVTSIGNYTFNNCSSLADVVIEDRTSELTLGSNGSSPLFASCPLDSVYIGGKIKYNTSSSSGYSPFYRNTSLRTIVISDTEDEIYNNEFYGCTSLKNVTMGDGVKKIGNWAFSGCSNLDYFNFGSGMQSIGDEAFSDCTNLTMLISYAEVPPTCGSMALDDINKWECVLRVPQNRLSAYQAADQWKEFFFIEDVLTGINEIEAETEGDAQGDVRGDVYSLNGTLLKRNVNVNRLNSILPAGLYVVNGKKVVVK